MGGAFNVVVNCLLVTVSGDALPPPRRPPAPIWTMTDMTLITCAAEVNNKLKVPALPLRISTRLGTFTCAKQARPYYSCMWTKQHQALCITCGRNTNHVTHYKKDDGGGPLTAEVQCAEHREAPPAARSGQYQAAWLAQTAEPAA